MRAPVDADGIRALARELARVMRRETTLYLTGGATAVIEGWRAPTVHVDLRLEPQSDELLRRISTVKDELCLNVELASPPDFIPELPGWRERSPFVFQEGSIVVRHFDPYSQALSKIERGFVQDLDDVASMVSDGLIDPERVQKLFVAIEPELFRYPAIDAGAFRAKVAGAFGAPRRVLYGQSPGPHHPRDGTLLGALFESPRPVRPARPRVEVRSAPGGGRRCRRASVLDRHDNDPVLGLEVDVHKEQPAPRAEQKPEPIPAPAQRRTHTWKSLQRAQRAGYATACVGRQAVGSDERIEVLDSGAGQLDGGHRGSYN